MSQVTSPVLSPPLLLATDGSPSARLAQQLMRLVASVFLDYDDGKGRSLLTALTISPRSSSRSNRLLRKKLRILAVLRIYHQPYPLQQNQMNLFLP